MFISRKRWNQMERRVAALEKICRPDVSPLSRMKKAFSDSVDSHTHTMPICMEIDEKTFAQFANNIHPGNAFRPEDSDGFRDSHGAPSVCFTTAIPKCKTERLENLDELETIHRNLYTDACNLHDELDKDTPNMEYVKLLSKSIHMEAHKAIDFEFIVTQRTVKEC